MAHSHGPSRVELATLLVPADVLDGTASSSSSRGSNHDNAYHHSTNPHTQEVILQLHDVAAAKASTALTATVDSRAGVGVTTGCTNVDITAGNATIQCVVDLTTLSKLAGATEDDFVIGLHREANDHHYNPDDSTEDGNLDNNDNGLTDTAQIEMEESEVGEKRPLVERMASLREDGETMTMTTTDFALDVTAFANTLADAGPIVDSHSFAPLFERVTHGVTGHQHQISETRLSLNFRASTTTQDDVQLGHDAFLLELPTPNGEKGHQYVLALPEIKNDFEDESSLSTTDHHRFPTHPMIAKAMSFVPAVPRDLPTDIMDLQLEATTIVDAGDDKTTATELQLDLIVKREVPLVGYVILLTGFLALASVGTALKLQGNEATPIMKSYWRVSATAMALLPMAIHSIRRDGPPNLTRSQALSFPLAAIAYAEKTSAFVIALSMTSLANSFILTNLTSLVLIAVKFATGVPIVVTEVLGAAIGFAGAFVCAGDTEGGEDDRGDAVLAVALEAPSRDPHRELLGNIIALSASFSMAAYLTIAKDLRANCNVCVFMFVIMALGSVFILLFMIVSGEIVTLSMHPIHGIFGWMTPTPDRLPLELYMVFSCNLLGTMGYIAVLKYFDSVVVATIMLMEPAVAAFFGFWAGLDPLPKLQTWVGNAIVMVGSGIVIYSGSKKTEHIDATQALRPRSNTIGISTLRHSIVAAERVSRAV